jgi:FMN phosphatase YigB (HAD superfamily)/DNA-binding XRE family transcriptional regulator
MDEMALASRLQLARRRAGMTQEQLCQKAGLSYSTLAKIERGAIRSPSVFTVAAIASATGTPLEDLLDLASRGLKSPTAAETKKRSKSGVRFVFFDVHGTLVHFYNRAFTNISADAHMPVDMVETFFWRHNDVLCTGQMNLQEFNKLLAHDYGLADFDWHKYYMDTIEPIAETNELIDWVAKNYEIGILSNSMPNLVQELLDQKLVPNPKYTVIVESCKVGAVKPDRQIYETAQQLASVEANEILMVDNERPYLTAADKLGWQVVWFDELNPEDSIARVKAALEF